MSTHDTSTRFGVQPSTYDIWPTSFYFLPNAGNPVFAEAHPLDALRFAYGPILCHGTAQIDTTPLLGQFARACALDVLHLWDAPDVVRAYLTTGDETIREDAARAAWDAYQATYYGGSGVTQKASRAAAYATRPVRSAVDAVHQALITNETVCAAAGAAGSACTCATSCHCAAGPAAKDAYHTLQTRQRRRFADLVAQAFVSVGVTL
jgi:hypothetical protein